MGDNAGIQDETTESLVLLHALCVALSHGTISLKSHLLPITRRQILGSSKLKEFTYDNFKFSENSRKLSKWVENTVGKGEIAHYEQFLLFPQCFQKACFPGASKGVIVWEWVKMSSRGWNPQPQVFKLSALPTELWGAGEGMGFGYVHANNNVPDIN